MSEIEWKSVEPGVWKPQEEGDSVQGVYIAMEPKEGETSARYYLDNKGKKIMVWGSAVLDDRMKLVKPGDLVKVTFNGKTRNKAGRDVNIFIVEVGSVRSPPKAKPGEPPVEERI